MKSVCKILMLGLVFAVATVSAVAETVVGKVVSIADGDTITVLAGETQVKVRLHGIDTPETRQDYGTVAKDFTADRCFGEVVTVVVTDTDRYGRKVGLIVLGDGRVLNHELVAAGLAHWYEEYARGDLALERLQDEARAAKRGLWSRPDAIAPSEFRKGKRNGDAEPYNPPSAQGEKAVSNGASPDVAKAVVYITNSGTKYHRDGCRSLRSSKKAVSLEEAKKRYEPCGICRP